MTRVSAVGDVRVFRDQPETLLAQVRDKIAEADIAFCQSESTYSDKGSMGSSGLRGASPNDPRGYPALAEAGFDVISMASNHTMDWGRDALLDTVERMRRDGMHPIGAGEDLAAARRPAIVEHDGTRIAFLAYCSVAPKSYYAVPGRAGIAPMRAITHYEPLEEDQPGTPAEIMTWPLERDLVGVEEDVAQAREHADIVAVSMHWGVHFIPAVIADYQPTVAYRAIDAGADIIIGHHPHILKAIEVYKGKVIFYSLGNFALDTNDDRRADPPWLEKVNEAFLLYGSPGMRDYREVREANYSFIANFEVEDKQISKVWYEPVMINDRREPEMVAVDSPMGAEIVAYVESITERAGIDTRFRIEGNEVVVEIAD